MPSPGSSEPKISHSCDLMHNMIKRNFRTSGEAWEVAIYSNGQSLNYSELIRKSLELQL
jgi:hypothetical protein